MTFGKLLEMIDAMTEYCIDIESQNIGDAEWEWDSEEEIRRAYNRMPAKNLIENFIEFGGVI